MPNIKDQSTVDAIAREYCSNGRCKGKALEAIGYSRAYAIDSGRGCEVVFSNVRVKEAIRAIDEAKQEKYEHNQDIAITKLYSDYAYLDTQARAGNIPAIQARTAIVRELDAITGQHSKTIVSRDEGAVMLTEEEQTWLDELARQTKVRLSKQGTGTDGQADTLDTDECSEGIE